MGLSTLHTFYSAPETFFGSLANGRSHRTMAKGETRVEARLITPLDGGGSDSDRRSDRFREGDKVECRLSGRGKFYPGKIDRDRGDDTYDMRPLTIDGGVSPVETYDVAKRLIRKKDRSRSRSRSPRGGGLREGDKIEADYRGRGRFFYPGKISRDRGDDTYDGTTTMASAGRG